MQTQAHMPTQTHVHEEVLPASQERVFGLLSTPSAIRNWWGAARATVQPEPGGLWTAVWGGDEDAPDYITSATITAFEPPRRLVLSDYRYSARSGALPFDADFVTEFTVEPRAEGALLRVSQAGFPCTEEGDAFLAACDRGWRDTFAGIRSFLSSTLDGPSSDGATRVTGPSPSSRADRRLAFRGNNELALHVPDPAAAARFYAEVLGCTIVNTADDCIEVAADALRLFFLRDPSPTHDAVVPSFDVMNRAAALSYLEEAGCTLIPIGPHAPDGVYVRDPFGAIFDVIEREGGAASSGNP